MKNLPMVELGKRVMKHKHFRRFLLPFALLIALMTFLLPSKAQIFAQGAEVVRGQFEAKASVNQIYLPIVLAKANFSQERWAGTVSDENGVPLPATITINGVQGQVAADGSFALYVPKADDDRYVINAQILGYVPVSEIVVGTASEAINLALKQAEQFSIDPSQLALVEDGRGTKISIPAGSLVDADGNAATGPLQVLVYTYDLALEEMPGDMSALDSNGDSLALESAGVFYAHFMDDLGNEYNLAPNTQADISIPVDPSAPWPNVIPLWSYDETEGVWKEEGQATQTNGRFAGSVSHFSFWNFDVEKSDPACIKLTVDPAFLANNSPIKVKAVLLSPTRVRYLNINQATNVLINLPANTNVEFYMPPSSPIPFATVNTGAPWGGTGIPSYPYDDCNGTLDMPPSNVSGVSGMKFHDLNNDGVKEPGEPGLFGWQITLTDASGNILTTTTDVAGNYWFMPLAAGTYTVAEVQQNGWTQTFPTTPGTHSVTLQAGQVLSGLNFGNWTDQELECDLTISKEHEGNNFFYGEAGFYNFMISNNGSGACEGPILMVDTLPAGMSVPFITTLINDWTCTAGTQNPQAVLCAHAGPLPAGSSLPLIWLRVDVPDASSANGFGWSGNVATNCGHAQSSSNTEQSCDQVTVVSPSLR